jgi:hypothetical protein
MFPVLLTRHLSGIDVASLKGEVVFACLPHDPAADIDVLARNHARVV